MRLAVSFISMNQDKRIGKIINIDGLYLRVKFYDDSKTKDFVFPQCFMKIGSLYGMSRFENIWMSIWKTLFSYSDGSKL